MKNAYRIDVTSGDCSIISESKVEKGYNKVPEDIILKLNTKSYGVLVSDGMTCTVRLKDLTGKKPIWYSRFKTLAFNNKYPTDDVICVEVVVKDEGDGIIGVYHSIEPNIESDCIYQGSSEKFFNGEELPTEWRWLSSYISERVKFYDWLGIACIHLMFTIDVRKGFDDSNAKYFRGITTEKGLFGGENDEFCPEGEYTIAEIICM